MTQFSKRQSSGNAAGEPDEQAKNAESARRVAVALSYADQASNAPRVVAAGKGELAEAILASAFVNDVKVRTDPDLAAILASVDVGSEIPEEAFVAVAEILSYLYRVSPEKTPDFLKPDGPPPTSGAPIPGRSTRENPS